MSAYSFSLPALGTGTAIDLAAYAGQPMVIANTASLCGFTPQYQGLQTLWTDYKSRGLVVLAVPSADFGNQEHADAAETARVCEGRFNIDFPIAATAHVSGAQATPLFRWLGDQAGIAGRPRWNFYKYVIGRDGRLLAWFSSLTRPEGTRIRSMVEKALSQ